MTVDELKEILEDYDGDMEVHIAFQPSWPLEYSIDSDAVAEHDGILYLAERDQVGYLPGEVRPQLGWRWE